MSPDSQIPETENEWSAEELTDDEWAAFVAYGLEAELNDPREDIYTFNEGKPTTDSP